MAVIGTIRQKLGGLLILLIAFAMLAFILMDMGPKGNNAGQAGNSIAKVNGEEISYIEFTERLKTNENYMIGQMQGQALTESQKESLKTSTFNEMLGEKLKGEMYKKLGISVSKAEKAAMLFDDKFQHPSIKSSFSGADGVFSQESFKQYLNTLDLPDANFKEGEKRAQWTNFEKAIYKERADKKYNTLVQKSIVVPTWMATALYNNDNTMASIEYVYLPYSDIDDASITLSDQELASYLASHSKEFQQEESASLKYINFQVSPSADDINAVKTWIDGKFDAWQNAESDSLFIMASSETRWDESYYRKDELVNRFSDSIFASSPGAFFGPLNLGTEFAAYKLIDKKAIPDSLKVRHLLLSGDNLQTQEDVDAIFALRDSLMNLVDTLGVPLSSLTAQFSDDQSNAFNGGDLEWVRPGEMVVPFNDLIFYDMKPGDIKTVGTQFGIHIVEVYQWGTTSTAVQLATLNRSIFASEETTNAIFAEASLYANNNKNKEAFLANSSEVKDALNVSKLAATIPGLDGNAR
ncbi:MAG: SurA N-terminal domain-containing protein, partial [Bacteroidetes bacterium]|nr:SurA N-terminal domain-containing protein [Bacteroidota bacterium]